MATAEEGKLTDRHIAELAEEDVTSAENMETIALKYLGHKQTLIDSLKTKHRENQQAVKRDILTKWKCKNPGLNQIYVSTT